MSIKNKGIYIQNWEIVLFFFWGAKSKNMIFFFFFLPLHFFFTWSPPNITLPISDHSHNSYGAKQKNFLCPYNVSKTKLLKSSFSGELLNPRRTSVTTNPSSQQLLEYMTITAPKKLRKCLHPCYYLQILLPVISK